MGRKLKSHFRKEGAHQQQIKHSGATMTKKITTTGAAVTSKLGEAEGKKIKKKEAKTLGKMW